MGGYISVELSTNLRSPVVDDGGACCAFALDRERRAERLRPVALIRGAMELLQDDYALEG